MKRKTLGVAVAVAIGVLSTSAFAVSPYGNATQKGSLVIFPKVELSTIIQLTNDFSGDVWLKCYYMSNEDIDGQWPAASSPSNYTRKHKTDFQFHMTKNQTVWFDGFGNSSSQIQGIPAVFPMADGFTGATAADLKCWAVNADASDAIHFNHLVGTATVVRDGQAWTYNAYHFQADKPSNDSANTNALLATAGTLNLDGLMYDKCSLQAIGNINAVTTSFSGSTSGQVDLIQCTQDLRETYTPPVTKYVFQFWNENEVLLTGTEVCGDSFIEIDLWTLPHARRSNLRTDKAYFRATGVGQICPNAKDGGIMGVLAQKWPGGWLTGSTLNGRGSTNGKIYWDTGPTGGSGGVPSGDITKQ